MKCKSKLYFYVLMPLLCFALVLPNYTIPSYASTTNSGSNPTVSEVINDGNIYDIFSYVSRKYASFPDYVGGSPITSWSYDAYADWLDSKGQLNLLDEPVSIINESSGGRGYDIPQAVRQSMVDYVNEVYIQQNPLTYTECYIHTYNMVNVQWFPTYQLYQTWKSWASQQDGFILTKSYIANGSTQGIRACVIPKTNDINFVGTTSGGVFTNVAMYIGWSATNTPWTIASGSKWVEILNNGTIRDFNGAGQSASTLGNTTNIHDSTTSRMTIWTNLPKDEKVYVFNSLNALKAYNSASPQSYYLPTGSTMNVPYSDIFTDEDLLRAGSYYNSIVDNSQSGWTAEQVLALVDRILLSNSGSSGSGSSDDNDGWLDLGIFGDIGRAIAKILGGIIEAIATVFTEIIGIITNVSETLLQGVIFDFLSALLGWLPDEIIAVLTALFSIAVLFALIKLIREAF